MLKLQALGQSVWLDFIRRGMLVSGELERLIERDGVRGVTVNPTILDEAIRETHDYDVAIEALLEQNKIPAEICEILAVEDVQRAADLFRSLYDETNGRHGFVSLEISPHLAYDTEGTLEEARRFWRELDRPNVMLKVPGTSEGVPAIRQLTAEGINVNVTLLFGLPRYWEVANAYVTGLEDRTAQGESVNRIASVASFFLSRIDTLVDPMLEELVGRGGPQAEHAARLRGEVATASAKVAYELYQEHFRSERFHELADRGARTQRLLWASTSTKNPAYSDVKYVKPLIGPDTVNTMPMSTLEAFRQHGMVALTLPQDIEFAHRVLASLPGLGIDLDEVTKQLEIEGVAKFSRSYDSLLAELAERRAVAV